MRKTVFTGLTVKHHARKRVPASDGGKYVVVVADGIIELTYSVDLDIGALEAMAHKAAENKSGRAQDGPLMVTVTQRRRL